MITDWSSVLFTLYLIANGKHAASLLLCSFRWVLHDAVGQWPHCCTPAVVLQRKQHRPSFPEAVSPSPCPWSVSSEWPGMMGWLSFFSLWSTWALSSILARPNSLKEIKKTSCPNWTFRFCKLHYWKYIFRARLWGFIRDMNRWMQQKNKYWLTFLEWKKVHVGTFQAQHVFCIPDPHLPVCPCRSLSLRRPWVCPACIGASRSRPWASRRPRPRRCAAASALRHLDMQTSLCESRLSNKKWSSPSEQFIKSREIYLQDKSTIITNWVD